MPSWWKADRDVYAQIARKNYPRAIKLLKKELRRDTRSVHLRQLLADVLARDGNRSQAIKILEPLVDDFAAEGFVAKAIAVLKKIQRIDPERSDIDLKLASLIEGQGSAHEPEKAQLENDAPNRARTTVETSARAFPTSELRSNWFEEALEQRQDFHWSPVLSGFTKDELAALIGGLRLLVKKPGAIIYGEDEPGESLFILASGKARVYRRNGVGHYDQVGVRQDGDFFGEASVLTASNRRSTVTAATECELLELDRKTFDTISEKYPRVCETIQQLHESRIASESSSWG